MVLEVEVDTNLDMTVYRQRTSSRSSQLSFSSTSGESVSGESINPVYTPPLNGLNTDYYFDVHMDTVVNEHSGSGAMLNGYHTPPPHLHSFGYHPLTSGISTGNGIMTGSTGSSEDSGQETVTSGYSSGDCNHHTHLQMNRPSSSSIFQNGHRPRAKTLDSGSMGKHSTSVGYPHHTDNNVSGKSLSKSYDASMAKILELHRTLAQSYQTQSEPKLRSKSNFSGARYQEEFSDHSMYPTPTQHEPRDEPPELPVRKNRPSDIGTLDLARPTMNGAYPQNSYVNRRSRKDSDVDSCHSNSTSTPNSSTPSTPTSETIHGVPNGYATIRGKPPKFNLHTISENLGQFFSKPALKMRTGSSDDEQLSPTHTSTPLKASRPRSNSIGNILGISSLFGTSTEDEPDSDENNDDYGFLSPMFTSLHSSVNVSSAAMHKAKSPTPAHRIIPKKWRKSKLLTPGGAVGKTTSLWKPKGNCCWESVSGKTVTLTGTRLIHLTDLERLVLQKIAHARLQALQLGCSIHIPKDGGSKRSKRSAFSLKRKTSSDQKGGWVFGIPLSKCVSNDVMLRHRKASFLQERKDSLDMTAVSRHIGRKSSCSSVSVESNVNSSGLLGRSLSASPSRVTTPPPLDVVRSFSYNAGAVSSDSLSESDSRHGSSNLLDALSLSSSAKLDAKLQRAWRNTRNSLNPHTLQVPYIVNSCFTHLESFGLRTLGIFRIGSSKKRIKQMREEFDCGKDVALTEDHSPHDVAGLLKEYFRDLPDPLLTKDLYCAFLASRKLKDESLRHQSLRDLIALLPAANRDTLWALLNFLSLVVQHSSDAIDEHGNQVPGNKMDAHNLATLFGPNLLHKAKGGEYEVETPERAEERKEVIHVIQDLITSYDILYRISAEEYDGIIRTMHDSNPDAADYLLKKKSMFVGVEADPETSTSSFVEESDSSSIHRSQSYTSDTEHSRSFTEGLPNAGHVTTGVGHVTVGLSPTKRAQPPETPHLELLQVPQFHISSTSSDWYNSDSISPSPVSPRVSPSPKALKPTTPNLQIRITPGSPLPGDRYATPSPGVTGPARISLRTSRSSKGQMASEHFLSRGHQHHDYSSIPHPASYSTSSNQLTVPTTRLGRNSRDSDSSSSSSYYPSSSRSTTNSPKTPDSPDSPWTPDPTRTSSLHFNQQGDSLRTSPRVHRTHTPETENRTSSVQRPLGIRQESSRPIETSQGRKIEVYKSHHHRPSEAPKWHTERWKHWEKLAKQNSEEFHEQETLV